MKLKWRYYLEKNVCVCVRGWGARSTGLQFFTRGGGTLSGDWGVALSVSNETNVLVDVTN